MELCDSSECYKHGTTVIIVKVVSIMTYQINTAMLYKFDTFTWLEAGDQKQHLDHMLFNPWVYFYMHFWLSCKLQQYYCADITYFGRYDGTLHLLTLAIILSYRHRWVCRRFSGLYSWSLVCQYWWQLLLLLSNRVHRRWTADWWWMCWLVCIR